MPHLASLLSVWAATPCAVCHVLARDSVCAACVERFATPRPRCPGCAIALAPGVPRCAACLREPLPLAAVVALAYEAGEAMAHAHCGAWDALGPDAARVRHAVFIQEQGIPADIEVDELDATAVHVVLRNRLGMPVATGRLLQHAPGEGRIGRMAVERALRSGGWGRQVLRALEDAARARGDQRVLLHAQVQARAFYERAGYHIHGEPWMEAGIPHITMQRAL